MMGLKLREIAQGTMEKVVALRRHFYVNPRLSWDEADTLSDIIKWVKEQGLMRNLKLHEGQGGIWFDLITGSDKPLVIFRADIDALAIQDEIATDYRSPVDGVSHKCGHDAHPAILLIAMHGIINLVLRVGIDVLPINIRFVFQRAEENYTAEQGSGGKVMVHNDGICNDVDAAIGLHVWSPKPSGFWTRPGTLLCNSDRSRLIIRTDGGHAGMPHEADNALDRMDDLIPMIRQLPQRLAPADTLSVITHSNCHAGGGLEDANVVPIEAVRCWSIRNETDHGKVAVKNGLRELVARMLRGVDHDLEYIDGHPATVLDHDLVEQTAALIGEEARTDHPLIGGGEDFSHIAAKVPAVMYMMGTGAIPGKTDIPLHKPLFDIDESRLPDGVWFWLRMATGLQIQKLTD